MQIAYDKASHCQGNLFTFWVEFSSLLQAKIEEVAGNGLFTVVVLLINGLTSEERSE
jgi:hypothetical protein